MLINGLYSVYNIEGVTAPQNRGIRLCLGAVTPIFVEDAKIQFLNKQIDIKQEKMDKKYISAPLPFQGQKRRYIREFSNIIKTLSPAIVVDLFGGSGLLSYTAKRASPKSRVIYNDYDNYCERLAHVEHTNNMIRYFRELLHGYPADAKITGSLKETILQK